MKALLLLLALALAGHGAAGQACGEGSFHCLVYSLNGKTVPDLRYELLAFDTQALPDNGPWYQLCQSAFWGKMLRKNELDQARAAGLLKPKAPLVGLQATGSDATAANRFRLPYAGPVVGGDLRFHTLEGGWQPCIIKLTAGAASCYILCNPFGGCDGKVSILWSEVPVLVDWSSYYK